MSWKIVRRVAGWVALGLLGLTVSGVGFVAWQGSRTPSGRADYVALGSSFAAGAGLGPLQEGSPLMCARSVGGYPQRLARLTGRAIVDVSCGGAVTRHLLAGGQFFQGPQIRVIGPDTRLVTITAGGNDIGYVGDMSLLAARKDANLFGWMVRRFWKGPKPVNARDWEGLTRDLTATIIAAKARAPRARIVVATYPTLMPGEGTCDRIGLTAQEADLIGRVGTRLAATTQAAAEAQGAGVVDMHALGVGHDACSTKPWVTGWRDAGKAPFHPTAAGAEATARAIAATLTEAD